MKRVALNENLYLNNSFWINRNNEIHLQAYWKFWRHTLVRFVAGIFLRCWLTLFFNGHFVLIQCLKITLFTPSFLNCHVADLLVHMYG